MNKYEPLSSVSVVNAIITNQKEKGKSRAGRSGSMFELVIRSLEQIGFECYNHQEYEDKRREKLLPRRYIIRNAPYDNLLRKKAREYGIERSKSSPRTEFVVVAHDAKSTRQFPTDSGFLEIRIECKWQAVKGTTQSKLFFTVLDLQFGAPEKDVILLMDGAGFDEITHKLVEEICQDGVYWKRCPPNSCKNIRKMRLKDFLSWANEAFV